MKSKKFSHTFSNLKLTKIIKFELIIFVVLIIAYHMIGYFLVLVNGSSMEPTFTNNNILYFSKNVEKINSEDIVVVHVDGDTLVKRITGVPGEIYYIDTNEPVSYIMHSSFFGQKEEWFIRMKINKMVIPKGYFFIEGDAQQSTDSKNFGLVKKDDIFGKYISKI